MADIGIVYGPEFQGLSNIVSSTMDNLAAAKIVNPPLHQNAAFLFHLACINTCLHLLLVTLAKGIRRNFRDLCIPTTIKDLAISQSALEMDAVAWSKGLDNLSVDCMADGKLALRLHGLKLTPMDGSKASKAEAHAAACLEWLPDFDMVDHATLFKGPPSIEEETRM
ncbi:hypothetical protein VTN96DRAFT_4350 [Rasamsonia emersonii]